LYCILPRRPVFGPHWRGPFTRRVALFIDWQNAYKSARTAFGLESYGNERGNFSPYALGRLLAAGNQRGFDGGELVLVQVHRGIPSNKHDPVGYAANRRQATAWVRENEDVVKVRLRPLAYWSGPRGPAVEKGIDVELALASVEHVLLKRCDTAIILSHDTDLAPAVELIARLKGPAAVETVSWKSYGFSSRLKPISGVYHHAVSSEVFHRIETPINYAYLGSDN
jgi:uncharacterized LabA/DUF88 family protein